MNPDWQQLFLAIKALQPASLHMIEPNNWYVSQSRVELGDNKLLRNVCGRGLSPERAVLDHWQQLTSLPDGWRVVVDAYGNRREVAWNGFMWIDAGIQFATSTTETRNAGQS